MLTLPASLLHPPEIEARLNDLSLTTRPSNWVCRNRVLVLITWQQVRQLKEQVKLSREQATTSIEDHLTEQYREIMKDVPLDIWLGSELKGLAPSPVRQNCCRDAIYRYIDLSQEQAFLHSKNRVTPETWAEWRSGIRSNMELPAFREVWAQIEKKWPQSFVELKAALV